MKKYQLVLLMKSGIGKEKKAKFLSDLSKWVEGYTKEEVKELGEKKLAYPIKHEQKADYVSVGFEASKVDGLDKRLVISDDIIRHMLLAE